MKIKYICSSLPLVILQICNNYLIFEYNIESSDEVNLDSHKHNYLFRTKLYIALILLIPYYFYFVNKNFFRDKYIKAYLSTIIELFYDKKYIKNQIYHPKKIEIVNDFELLENLT